MEATSAAKLSSAFSTPSPSLKITNPISFEPCSSIYLPTVWSERQVLTDQARESGKPDNVIEKMIVGRMQKFYKEVVLVEQPFVMNPDQTVGEFLKGEGATLKGFVNFKLGDGIEKEEDNFADEVASMTKGA